MKHNHTGILESHKGWLIEILETKLPPNPKGFALLHSPQGEIAYLLPIYFSPQQCEEKAKAAIDWLETEEGQEKKAKLELKRSAFRKILRCPPVDGVQVSFGNNSATLNLALELATRFAKQNNKRD